MNKFLQALSTPASKSVDVWRPLVSFLICTFGRVARQPELLNEAVWWACQQDYPNIEVLVLNDAPKQKLHINKQLYPRVRIVNWPERCPDLGTKYNLAVTLAAGSICCWCEDDDISLPWRADQAAYHLQMHDFWRPQLWVFAEEKRVCQVDGNGVGFSSGAFRREAFIGRFQPTFKDVDQQAMLYAATSTRVNKKTLLKKPEKISYIYRWGVSQLHLSGHNDAEQAYKDFWPGRNGDYEIKPHCPIDWVGEQKAAVERYLENGPP